MSASNMDVIVSLSKRRGFIFQSSEIYGGTGSCWDYGPLRVELNNNIKRVWWRDFVLQRGDQRQQVHHQGRRAVQALRRAPHAVPGMRQGRVDAAAAVQSHVQDVHGASRGRRGA